MGPALVRPHQDARRPRRLAAPQARRPHAGSRRSAASASASATPPESSGSAHAIRRLVTTYLALTLVVLAALEIPLAITYRDRQLDQLEAGLERDAFVIAAYIEDTLNGDDNLDLQQSSTTTRRPHAGRAVIVDRNGHVLADSDPLIEGAADAGVPRDFSSRPEIASALTDKDITTPGSTTRPAFGTGLVYVRRCR